MADNPKTDPQPGSNTIKDPEDWVSGDEPMTGAQSSYLGLGGFSLFHTVSFCST